jgi:hypothetical protein
LKLAELHPRLKKDLLHQEHTPPAPPAPDPGLLDASADIEVLLANLPVADTKANDPVVIRVVILQVLQDQAGTRVTVPRIPVDIRVEIPAADTRGSVPAGIKAAVQAVVIRVSVRVDIRAATPAIVQVDTRVSVRVVIRAAIPVALPVDIRVNGPVDIRVAVDIRVSGLQVPAAPAHLHPVVTDQDRVAIKVRGQVMGRGPVVREGRVVPVDRVVQVAQAEQGALRSAQIKKLRPSVS